MIKKEDAEQMGKALDTLEEFAFKAAENDGISMHHTESPGKKTLSVNVDHGPGADARGAAVAKAHAKAREHGMDPAKAEIRTSGYGDRHTTSCTYGM